MANWIMEALGQRDQGQKMWGDYLSELQKLQQGATTPQEMPQFKAMMEMFNKIGTMKDANLERDLTAKGVTGGALGDIMGRGQEDRNKQLMSAINEMYSKAYGQVPEAAQTTQQNWMKMLQMAMGHKQAKSAEEAAKDAQQKGMIGNIAGGVAGGLGSMKGGGGGGGGMCCFMFIMGEGKIIDQVQKFKYENFAYDSYVANGYRWMSLKLMPIIRRNKSIKKLIRFLITKPLSRFAVYHYNKDPRGLLYVPAGLFWCIVWNLIGRVVAYNSMAYQEMLIANAIP